MESYKRTTVWEYNCLRCGHAWFPRSPVLADAEIPVGELPRVCPKCKSPYWNTPKRSPETVEQEARLRERGGELRLRYTGYPDPAGPWVVTLGESVGAPPLGIGSTAEEAVDGALRHLESPRK